ncbi:endonuclease I [Ancylomarina subtilis]|uniref:Endonuclease I n=1 Tax=Ancylomarina subtilis TaxID=1639035 RepID=A0A4Q7VMD7_9BACT|nr:endonuclease [Ancylomarina subtilis]RZT97439.1 endonuclease I [Ancylomarina subtilis]
MRRILLILLIASFAFSCSDSDNKPSEFETAYNGYYKSISGYDQANLKTVLHNLIKGHTQIEYTDNSSDMDVWRALEQTDEDPNNPDNVILLYLGTSIPKANKAKNNQNDFWNREHVWAKSRGDFGTTLGAGTDLHHLRPSDKTVNSARGNKWFDNGGNYHSEAKECKTDSDSWEPRDAVKGDIARMMFYMAVRYEKEDGKDLELTNNPQDNEDPQHGVLSTLLEWNEQDPVDDFEKKRNETIYSIQGNRNPFIDFPDFANYIFVANN